MKRYLQTLLALTITLAMTTISLAQQEKEFKIPHTSGKLYIADIDEVTIVGYNGSDIIFISMKEDIKDEARMAGLRMINSLGLEDNTGLGISVVKENDVVIARQISSMCDCEAVTVKVPRGVKVAVEHGGMNGDYISIKNIEAEVEVTTNYQDVLLEDVTGPMAIKTVYGKVEGEFKSISQVGSISIYSVYDLVDLTIPAVSNANISLTTPYGSVYSNMDIDVTASSKGQTNTCSSGGGFIKGTLGSGGVDFNVKSSYENIYLRK